MILLILWIIAGLSGDNPGVNYSKPEIIPVEPAATGHIVNQEWRDHPLKDARQLKCHGFTVFEVARELMNRGYNNPYTGDRCGTEVRQLQYTTAGYKSVNVPFSEDQPVNAQERQTKMVPTLIQHNESDTIQFGDNEQCWRDWLRWLGVTNWRTITEEPKDQPNILFPQPELQFIRGSRWEGFECGQTVQPTPGPERRYIGTGSVVSGSDDSKWQEFTDHVDQRISELEDQIGSKNLSAEMRTSYEAETGLVANQGQYRQGLHEATGEATLENGQAIIDLNTKVSPGRRDVSFLDSTSYAGMISPLDTTRGNHYRLVPLSGRRFKIVSSDSTDTATVNYRVMGD